MGTLVAEYYAQEVPESIVADQVSTLPVQAAAVDDEQGGLVGMLNSGTAREPSNLAPLSRLFGGFALLAGIGAAVVILARSGVLRRVLHKSNGRLQIEETAMLGNRQFIVVVRYGKERRLVGVGPGLINDLCSLPTTEEEPLKSSENQPSKSEVETLPQPSFAQQLNALLGGRRPLKE